MSTQPEAVDGSTRTERDTMGPVEVPADRYWGAQTQRSLEHFDIGRDTFVWGRPVVRGLGLLKKAAALANAELGLLPQEVADAVVRAADEVARGELDDHFPLVVFQTGSGTQSNMNANEVVANRAVELLGGELGSKDPVHPNDHVNRSQSSNDTFPTAVHVAVALELAERLHPAVDALCAALDGKAAELGDVVKVGRTHLQDATPVTLGQEIGAWAGQLREAQADVRYAGERVLALAIGGTAVGTGLNAPAAFGPTVARHLEAETGLAFRQADNLFVQLAAHDALVAVSSSLRTLAGGLMKLANDVRWLASGPRTGIGELRIPENEPGSSIMPGKVNPTQSEAMTMVVTRVFGNDATVGFAGTQGNFQLNVFTPVMAHAVLESVRLAADACRSFREHCVEGLEADRERIAEHLDADLMLVTALAPHIGYDAAAAIAKQAHRDGSTLREAALASGHVTDEDYDRWVDPAAMTRPD
ncbi:class II fumarate hydratase [Phycicoccus sp. MAQZ13P-2]|uniref:class II fumarate hydratase n=1 Tax=Phycicoccus mangrovi TaxID=2840470 RepID=UPI001C00103C|nr:class II fumarate hydratase [Phycicoccus mangrovi]MBT9256927.1 class II fumarate hydratase [Phycicoccus mangrovi]MBT9274924.1 class II fumarate hydratase [Phycicoccus mangrovi]